MHMSQEILDRLKNAVAEQDLAGGIAAAKDAVAANIETMVAIEEGLAAGMAIISELFDEGEIFVPQIIISAKTFDKAVAILTENMSAEDKLKASRGKVIVHTVQGDIHSIGKSLVGTMLGASGFEVLDLGVDVAVEHVVETAQKENVDIIAGSALLTTTMPRMRDIVNLLKELGVRDKFKCMFGGAPVVEEWVMEFADGYAETATGAVKLALKFMEEKKGA
jgi:trimethylamine corrinoid protein